MVMEWLFSYFLIEYRRKFEFMAEILIVDDEIGVRELLTEVLQNEGHSVILAANGAEAREQKKRPSIER